MRHMAHKLVFNVKQVAGFSPPGAEDTFVSRMLVDRESVGSNNLVMNHFTLKAGRATEPGTHPDPYDELYYVLRGRARLKLGDAPDVFDIEPGTVAFIPAGTAHSLDNTGDEELEILTVMAGQLVEGANAIYDARLRAWGTSFKLVGDE